MRENVDASLESGCCAVASRVEKNHLNAPKWEQIFDRVSGCQILLLNLVVKFAGAFQGWEGADEILGFDAQLYLVAICLSIDHLGVLELEQIFEVLAGMHTLPLGLFVNSAKMLFYGLRGKQGTRFGDLMSAWHLVASPFEHAHLKLLSIPKWYYPPPPLFEYLRWVL